MGDYWQVICFGALYGNNIDAPDSRQPRVLLYICLDSGQQVSLFAARNCALRQTKACGTAGLYFNKYQHLRIQAARIWCQAYQVDLAVRCAYISIQDRIALIHQVGGGFSLSP